LGTAAKYRLPNARADYRVIFGRVGTADENAFRKLSVVEGIYCAPRCRASFSSPPLTAYSSAAIDVASADNYPGEFLRHVILFVRRPRGSKDGRIASAFIYLCRARQTASWVSFATLQNVPCFNL
jgi:hypothetical protein